MLRGPIDISPEALQQAVLAGIGDYPEDSYPRLQLMWKEAVKCTHPKGNYRYKNTLFRVAGQKITEVSSVVCDDCDDTGYILVYEPCSECGGSGCPSCEQDGGSRRRIQCQACSQAGRLVHKRKQSPITKRRGKLPRKTLRLSDYR